MHMKLSCLPVSLFQDVQRGALNPVEWISIAKDIGYDGADISINFVQNNSYTYLKQWKQAIREAGVPIVMATSYPDFVHHDEAQRERELAYFARDISICSELGIQFLRITAGQAHPQTIREEGVRRVLDSFRKSSEHAKRQGVQLLFENHTKPGAWDHVDFSCPLDIFFEIQEHCPEMGIAVNFDIGNAVAAGENPIKVLDRLYDNVKTIHISDIRQEGAFSPVLIGTGVVPCLEIFSYLKSRNYDGWLCIEEASYMGMEGLKKAHDFVRETWEKAV